MKTTRRQTEFTIVVHDTRNAFYVQVKIKSSYYPAVSEKILGYAGGDFTFRG